MPRSAWVRALFHPVGWLLRPLTVVTIVCATLAVSAPPNSQLPDAAARLPVRVAQIVPRPRRSLPDPAIPAAVLPTDRNLQKRLSRGRELVQGDNYSEGVQVLQSVLEHGEDAFFHPTPDDRALYRSLKLEAQRLIGELPPAGREIYETQYGSLARQMFNEADARGNAAGLAAVVRQYFHTQAGYEAAYRLAANHLDHAHALAAALCFERLRSTPGAGDRFEPWLSLKAAYCWSRAGQPDAARRALQSLKGQGKPALLNLAGRSVALFAAPEQALTWLSTVLGPLEPASPPFQNLWAMPRGDPARNAFGTGSSPYLNRGWRISTVPGSAETPQQDDVIEQTFVARNREYVESELSRGHSFAPSAQPLVIDDLVVFRGFGNTRAVHLATGAVAWSSADCDQTLAEEIAPTPAARAVQQTAPRLAVLLGQRAFVDNTFGTQSSDGELVFAVEDLGYVGAWANNPAAPPFGVRDDNRLAAYELRTGRLVWKIGSRKDEFDDDFADTFFLGPPLPLGGRLYLLAEWHGEIRLMAVVSQTGRLEWSQTVVQTEMASAPDYQRRQCGLSPSYAAGVLVCPTETGAVVAVDLITRSLMWGFHYRNASSPQDPRLIRPFGAPMNGMGRGVGVMSNDQQHWLDSWPVVSEGKVLVTPRDGGELYCLDLFAGGLIWKRPRGDGLYVAGVHGGNVVVVGRSQVQAYRLADGAPAWREPTTVAAPGGHGFFSGDRLFLPLTSAEVVEIDMHSGAIVARARSRDGRVPGNLVGVRGRIVSQTVGEIECFPQIDALELEIAEKLRVEPDDVPALAARGEILMQRGKPREAYADLKRALAVRSDDPQVRKVLATSLLEGLRADFATYRSSSAEIRQLLTTPEQQGDYVRVLAEGLEQAGETRAAFDEYLHMIDPLIDPPMDRIDGALSLRRDRFAQAHMRALFERAAVGERETLDAAVLVRFNSALKRKNSAAAVYLDCFGGRSAAAAARDRWAGIVEERAQWLELEALLEPLEHDADRQIARTAAARRVSLLIAADRPREAASEITRIAAEWPNTPLLDGKTGAELVAGWRSNPVIDQELSGGLRWLTGVVDVALEPPPANGYLGNRGNVVAIDGERGRCFREAALEVDSRGGELAAVDGNGRSLWKIALPNPSPFIAPDVTRAIAHEHLVLVSTGWQVSAIDTLGTGDEPGARILWSFPFVETTSGANSIGMGTQARPIILPGGRQRIIVADQLGQPLGSLGPVTVDYAALQRGRRLFAVEPRTGKTLWVRDDQSPGAELFGDDEFVFVAPPDADEALVYDAATGQARGSRGIPPQGVRLAAWNRSVLTWRPEGDSQSLELHDIWAGRVTWRQQFAGDAKVQLLDLDEVAVLEPGGRFSIVSLNDGRARFEGRTEPEARLRSVLVFRGRDNYTVIANAAMPPLVGNMRITTAGVHGQAVAGWVYGFDRQTGEKLWTTRLEPQAIDVTQSPHLPILVFMSQALRSLPNNRGVESQAELLVLDRRNGRVIYQAKPTDVNLTYVEVLGDPENQTIELKLARPHVLNQSVVKLRFTNKPLPD